MDLGKSAFTMSALSIENLFGIRGYVALVTGGSSGLGFMISKVRNYFQFCISCTRRSKSYTGSDMN